MRVALIGLGKMGLSHCAIINTHPDVELVAVCDTTEYLLDILKKYTSVKTYTDYHKLIATEKLDAVFVATPSRVHPEMVRTDMVHPDAVQTVTVHPAEVLRTAIHPDAAQTEIIHPGEILLAEAHPAEAQMEKVLPISQHPEGKALRLQGAVLPAKTQAVPVSRAAFFHF